MKGKKILSIETSSELCSAAVYFDIDKYDERNVMLKHVHSERLIPIIEDLLKVNKLKTNELDCVAVSIGPGSFTGLRIGLTAAKGIAFSAGLPIVPVPTFDALALEISGYISGDHPFFIINNANVEECYFAEYDCRNGKVVRNGDVILEKKSNLNKKLDDESLIFGNIKDIDEIHLYGSPRASSVAKWTYLFGEDLLTFDFDYLEPNYLKNFKVRVEQ